MSFLEQGATALLFLSSHMAIKPYKFTRNYINQEVLELTVSQNVSKNNLYVDLLTGITDSTVTMQYPLNKEELHQYKEEISTLDYILGQYGLKDEKETKYHISNILYFIVEFKITYDKLLRKKKGDARVKQNVEFLKRVKGLSDIQKQQVKMSFVINHVPFSFDDAPFLSEIVINKLTGILRNEIKHLYPDQWEAYKGNKTFKSRTTADSTFRNRAVAKIAKLLVAYLNEESKVLSNQPSKTNIATLQKNFIYDILTLFNLYIPTDAAIKDKGSKVDYGDALRKHIERSL